MISLFTLLPFTLLGGPRAGQEARAGQWASLQSVLRLGGHVCLASRRSQPGPTAGEFLEVTVPWNRTSAFALQNLGKSSSMIAMTPPERQLEDHLIEKLRGLKYEYRADIRDRATLQKNSREKFESLNHVRPTDGEFQRLLG